MSHIQEKKATEQPRRYTYAKQQIENLGFETISSPCETFLQFKFKGNVINFFPYTGWASGKGIKDGRGIHNLLKQINHSHYER